MQPYQLMEMAFGYRLPRCLHAAVELGVPDVLGAAPMTAEALAAAVGAHAESLNRLMLTLASAGVFEAVEGGFQHNETSRLLRSENAALNGFVRFAAADYQWATWGGILHSVRTGGPSFDHIYGRHTFDYYKDHPEDGRIFDLAMTSKAASDNAAVVAAYDFSGFSRIADVGGGRGHLIRTILKATPTAQGLLFDLPEVAENAKAMGDNQRLSFVGGSFFDDDLPPADAYLMMMVLHDWSDERCVAILKNLRRTAPASAKLLVIEYNFPEGAGEIMPRLGDIHMMVLTGGRERTGRQYDALFAQAGFKLARAPIPTAGLMAIFEAVPV